MPARYTFSTTATRKVFFSFVWSLCVGKTQDLTTGALNSETWGNKKKDSSSADGPGMNNSSIWGRVLYQISYEAAIGMSRILPPTLLISYVPEEVLRTGKYKNGCR